MDRFILKKLNEVTVLSANVSEFSFKKHRHGEYCLGLTLKGTQECDLDGSRLVSYESGVMLFNPEQSHTGNALDQKNLEYVMIYLPTETLQKYLSSYQNICFEEPVIYEPSIAKTIYSAAKAAIDHDDSRGFEDNIVTAIDLLSHKKYIKEKDIYVPFNKQARLVNHIKNNINQNAINSLSLNELAEEVNVDKYQLIRLFKRYVGLTPYQYQLNVKIDRAKEIIEETRDVYEAVAKCNFVDLSHMNKQFKAIYGITSGRYLDYLNKSI